jgi:hypothetical protein
MSLFSRLDATRICARWSPDDPSVWATPVPVPERARPAAAPARYSWRALVRNPQALVLTGVVGTLVVLDAGARPFVRRQAVRSNPADSSPLLAAST